MKLRTFVVVFLFTAGIIAALGIGSWTLAAPPDRDLPTATVSVDVGQAWIQKGGEGEWTPVAAETPVTLGDHVKTGEKSRARVEFFDSSAARLDADTEISIDDLAVDEDNTTDQRVSIGVLAGRVWSRVEKFADKDSSYSARVSDVVATVRGTAFVMDATDPTGWVVRVTDNTVGVRIGADGEELAVPNGEEAWTAKNATSTVGRRFLRRKLAASFLADAWVGDSRRADQEFAKRLKDRMLQDQKTRAGVLPGSPLYGLKHVGERLRLALTSDGSRRRDLAIRYADRRFAEIVTLAASGREQAAERLLPDFHRRYLALLAEVKDKRVSGETASRLCRQLQGRFLEQLVRLRRADGPIAQAIDRLPPDAADVKELPRELRDRLCADAERLPVFPILPTIVPLEATTTEATVDANLNANLPVTINANKNANVNVNANLNVNVNVNTNQPVAPKPTVTKIAVTGQRTILYLPDSQQLRATATWSDGATQDVTDSAVWSSSDVNVLAVTNGMVLTAGLGTATISASFGGQVGGYAIRVVPQPTTTVPSVALQSLAVSCSPSAVEMYGSSTCSATAHYSDGSTKDATATASWSATLGMMQANVFVAYQMPGTATVTASYTDGTTVSGSDAVTIQ